MLRTLVVAAIVGYVAYHYGVDAGRHEARLHHPATVTDSSRAPVLDGRGEPLLASPHHHRQTADANGAKLAADGHRLVVTVQKKAHDLVIRATEAIPGGVKEKSASMLDDATRYLDKSFSGHRHSDDGDGQGEGRSI